MPWIKARLKENSTLLGLAVLVAMGGSLDLQVLQEMSTQDMAALLMALVATLKGD